MKMHEYNIKNSAFGKRQVESCYYYHLVSGYFNSKKACGVVDSLADRHAIIILLLRYKDP